MIYLLDTNAFSDLAKKHPRVSGRARTLPIGDRAVICPVVEGEIRYGLERLPSGKRRRDLEAEIAQLLRAIPCEPLPCAAGEFYAQLRLDCERHGLAVDDNDLWIAAAALASGATVVSRDTDFQHMRGLMVEDWSQ
jgi:tRNA(fMet)-specific endonuclease VapC